MSDDLTKRGMSDAEVLAMLEANVKAQADDLAKWKQVAEQLRKERDAAINDRERIRGLLSTALDERDRARNERDVFSSDNLRRERDAAVNALADVVGLLNHAGISPLVDGKPGTVAERVKKLVEERDELHAEMKRVVDVAIDECGMPTSAMLGADAPSRAMRKLKEQRDVAVCELRGVIEERDAAAAMHATATQNAVNAKATAEYLRNTRAEFEAQLERLQPLRTVLRSWDWQAMQANGAPTGDELAFLVGSFIRAMAAVEKAENEAAKAKAPR